MRSINGSINRLYWREFKRRARQRWRAWLGWTFTLVVLFVIYYIWFLLLIKDIPRG